MTEKDMLALLSYTIENPQDDQLDFIQPRQGDQLLLFDLMMNS
jgi:hypothetical protein